MPFLDVQRGRGETVGQYPVLPIEVCKCSFLLEVGHQGRITHSEASVDPTTTPAIRQHGEKGVFVGYVLLLTQTSRAVLFGRAEAVVGLAAQTNESVTSPFYVEQTGVGLSKALGARQQCSVSVRVSDVAGRILTPRKLPTSMKRGFERMLCSSAY